MVMKIKCPRRTRCEVAKLVTTSLDSELFLIEKLLFN